MAASDARDFDAQATSGEDMDLFAEQIAGDSLALEELAALNALGTWGSAGTFGSACGTAGSASTLSSQS